MGRRLASFFRSRGFHVLICDPAGAVRGFASAALEAASDADVVVVAASLERAAEALERVLEQEPRGLVFDIASVKAPLLPAIAKARARGVAITSVHPMFGPAVRSFRGRDLIVCDAGDAAAARRAKALFNGAGLKIRTIPIAEHDLWNAYTLGLTHFIALAASGALAELGVDLDEVDGRASTSFRHLLSLVEPILYQDPALTHGIQAGNPQSAFVVERIAEQVEAFRRLLLEENLPAFTDKVLAIRRALRPTS
jgi:chorismate mutase/prephenate dehydrogenase